VTGVNKCSLQFYLDLPIINCPSALTAICDISEQPAYTNYAAFQGAGGSATDKCGIDGATFQLASETSDGASCPEVVTRIYSIADSCGNTNTCSQIITIDDAEVPVINCPAALTAICDISEQPVYTNYAAFQGAGGSATDNCGIDGATFQLLSETSDGASCPEVVTRIYSTADSCGNTNTCSQIITIDDAENPVINCPGALTAICDISEQPAYANYAGFQGAGGSATDNCGIDGTTFQVVSETSDGASCPEVVTRIYSIADSCSNTNTCSQIITIDDAENPIINCPAALTAVCDISEQPAYTTYASFQAAGGSSTDNCGIDGATFQLVSETSDGASCPEVVTRIYSIADSCGNTNTCSQNITIDDAENPVITDDAQDGERAPEPEPPTIPPLI
jgi:peroxiredoxin